METEREFNIFGPINPAIHYHVDRMATKVNPNKIYVPDVPGLQSMYNGLTTSYQI